jgi:hypothetical protein
VSTSLNELRPLTLGELIDRSATFWRRHLKQLFTLYLGFGLVTYIFTKSLQLATYRIQRVAQEVMTGQLETGAVLLEYGRFLLLSVGTMLGLFWLYWMATLVVARYVVPTQLGETMRPSECFQHGMRKLGPLTGAYLLSLLWVVGVTLLMALPGVLTMGAGGALLAASGPGGRLTGAILLGLGVLLMVLGMLGAILWYMLRFSLLGPVLAMEELTAGKAFRRSGELLSGRVGPGFTGRVKVRAVILVTVVSVILVAVSLLFSLPALIVQFTYSNPMDPLAAVNNPVPQAMLVPAELFQVVGQALFAPLGLVLYAMFYVDMRVRREGLDLEQRLGGRPTPSVAA